jgi:hypothetical protein
MLEVVFLYSVIAYYQHWWVFGVIGFMNGVQLVFNYNRTGYWLGKE